LQLNGARVAVVVRVPVLERDVLGRHLDEAGAGFSQPARQEAAEAEAAGVVPVIRLLRLEREIERSGRRRAEEAVGVIHRAEKRLPDVIAAVLMDRAASDQLLVELLPVLEARGAHPMRRADRLHRLIGERDLERAVLAAQEAGRMERLQLLAFADVEPL